MVLSQIRIRSLGLDQGHVNLELLLAAVPLVDEDQDQEDNEDNEDEKR